MSKGLSCLSNVILKTVSGPTLVRRLRIHLGKDKRGIDRHVIGVEPGASLSYAAGKDLAPCIMLHLWGVSMV